MSKIEINSDGSMKGRSFSGTDYKGERPTPKHGKETYEEFYKRVQKAKENGYHLGDLSWGDYHIYCLGSPGGGGQYVSHYIIGEEPDDCWVTDEDDYDDDDDDW